LKITIAQRLQPYSHTPGISTVIPGSCYSVQVFPTLIRVFDLTLAKPQLIQEVPVPLKGPIKEFTVVCDLEKGGVIVWGFSLNGYFRYRIYADLNRVVCVQDRGELLFSDQKSTMPFHSPLEQLSLGSHKALDWDSFIRSPSSLQEVFPVWSALGQITPQMPIYPYEGAAQLLTSPSLSSPEDLYSIWNQLLKVGFYGILTPRLEDDQYQGIIPQAPIQNNQLSPLLLLTEGAKLIRSLFILQTDTQIRLLPYLLPEFHCGRFINVTIEGLGTIDFEWSKKTIRRVVFYSNADRELTFVFRHVRSCRLKQGLKDRGERMDVGTMVKVRVGEKYLFDNFL
jgi:hypothetical protein